MLIRKMECLDIDKIVEIEKELFTSPWDKDALYYESREKCFFDYFDFRE